jgi:hypothetical protein
MGPLSYMRSVVDQNVSMWRITVIGKMVLGNSGFHTRNNLSETNRNFGTRPQNCAPGMS